MDEKLKMSRKMSQKRKMRNFWISAAMFFTFSLVLFINNLSDLTAKFGLTIPINWIAWTGLICTTIYTWWMAAEDRI